MLPGGLPAADAPEGRRPTLAQTSRESPKHITLPLPPPKNCILGHAPHTLLGVGFFCESSDENIFNTFLLVAFNSFSLLAFFLHDKFGHFSNLEKCGFLLF